MHDTFTTALEFKFAADGAKGEFEGYGAVFGNIDSHGDAIMPGAFTQSLAETKASGRKVPMHLNHGHPLLSGRRGVGVWTDVAEDDKGLRVAGKISGMNTDSGRLLYEQVKDGAFPGLSVGYKVRTNGASYGTKAGEPKRTLKALHLAEISLVDSPSNASAIVDGVKAAFSDADPDKAASSLAAAMRMHDKVMQGYSYSGSSKDQALMMDHMRDAHEFLTGDRAPDGLDGWTKSDLTLREIEKMLREEFKLSHSQARAVAERRFNAPRDEGSKAMIEDADALREALSGFKLPTY